MKEEIPWYPSKCGKCGAVCEGNGTLVTFLSVKNLGGNIETGNSGKYLSPGSKVLRDGYDFVGWITRCCGCYSADLESKRKLISQKEETA